MSEKKKRQNLKPPSHSPASVSTVASRMDDVLERQGYAKGKLFVGKDKATFTFMDEYEVIVLHFDASRHEIYLKGHRLMRLDLKGKIPDYLGRFKKILHADGNLSKKFLAEFDFVWQRLMNEGGDNVILA